MKKFATLAALAMVSLTPAFAADVSQQVSKCASALDAQGLAASDAYRAKFVKSKGGTTQIVTLKLVPLATGESLTAECTIKRGEVTDAAIKNS